MTPIDPVRPVRRRVRVRAAPPGIRENVHVALFADGTLELREAWDRGEPVRLNLGRLLARELLERAGLFAWGDVREARRGRNGKHHQRKR